MLKKFMRSRSGNFAILSGVAVLPLCLAAGLAIDYSRHQSAQRHLQEIADATSLALASTKEQNQERLEQLANNYLAANRTSSRVDTVSVASVVATTESVDVELSGSIPTTFMGIAGYQKLDVAASALAERATRGAVEVSLILDNTESMDATAGSGTTRIAALKTAATQLVDALLKNSGGSVRIALVPYGENVNVGTANRGSAWLSVPADYSTVKENPAVPASCTYVSEEMVNTTQKPTYACTVIRDGAEFETTCGGGWNQEKRTYQPPIERCTKAKAASTSTTNYKWFGCVGSRTGTTNRLGDGNTSVRYPSFVETAQNCVNPIVRLTNERTVLNAAIAGMVTKVGNHKPKTFIPAGLVWGLHTLAPNGPFGDGQAYDSDNIRPRKVAVLMTDGANTMLYRKSDGKSAASATKLNDGERTKYVKDPTCTDNIADNDHWSCGLEPLGKGAYAQSNEDTLALCSGMRARNIEIFTVAFMVDDPVARDMLKACASSPDHYFEAANASILSAAFSGIAQSLQVVRLAR